MSNEEFADYPKGRISMGAGDLVDVFDIGHKYEVGEELVHTIRKNPAGSTGGKRKSEITFKAAIPAEGFERDYHGKAVKREKFQLRLKLPGKTITQVGRLSIVESHTSVDGFIEFTATHIGKMSLS